MRMQKKVLDPAQAVVTLKQSAEEMQKILAWARPTDGQLVEAKTLAYKMEDAVFEILDWTTDRQQERRHGTDRS